MKKIILIVALMLLLTSCSPSGVTDETEETKVGESSVIENSEDAVDDFLADLQFEPSAGISSSTLDHVTDITSYKSKDELKYNLYPEIYNDDQYTYLIRRYPEDLKTAEEISDFANNSERINTIEIFQNYAYSEPVETITLDGLSGKKYWPYLLSHNSEKDVFYVVIDEKIGDDFVPVYYEYSRAGEILNRFEFSGNIVNPMQCIGGLIYMINNDGYYTRASRLTVTDPATGEKTQLDDNVIDFYTEDSLLYYIKNTRTADYRNVQSVCTYDPATGSITALKDIQTDAVFTTVYYDTKNDVVYYTYDGKLFANKDGEEKLVMNAYDTSINISSAGGGNLFLLAGINQISLYKLTDEPVSLTDNMNVLKVCLHISDKDSFGARVSDAEDTMWAAGIPISFEYNTIGSEGVDIYTGEAEYVNAMAKKMLACDTDYDIFLVKSTMSELFESKYYEDLSNYPALTNYYDKFITGIKDLCSMEGKLTLAPMSLQLSAITYRPEVFTDPDDAPKTFDEFFENYNELSKNLDEDTYYYTAYYSANFIAPWLDELASNYFAEVISDESAENDLLRLFDCVYKLDDYNKIYIGTDYNKKSEMCNEGFNWGTKTVDEEYLYIPLPKLGEDYKYSVTGSFLAVNPNSPNKELALKFVAYYLNSIVSGDATSLIQYVKEGEVMASEEQISRYVDYETSKYKSFAEQIADSIHTTVADDLFSFARDLCIQIEDGTLTPEEAASRTLRYLKMMRDE